MNAPENREQAAEIMFETFNVPGLYIAVQAVMALAASWRSSATQIAADGSNPLTGTVVDIGDGVTHVIPVIDGYVVPSAIKHIPIAGKDITKFIQQMLRERGEAIPSEESLAVAQAIKERFGYVARHGLSREFEVFDAECAIKKRMLNKVPEKPNVYLNGRWPLVMNSLWDQKFSSAPKSCHPTTSSASQRSSISLCKRVPLMDAAPSTRYQIVGM
jgi:actin-related protein